MANIKLFSLSGEVSELPSTSVALEIELQNTVEKNMLKFFGVRFLASEFQVSNGRVDSVGIDENYCPVIFEYKRSADENAVNQGLLYLNHLMRNPSVFKLLVLDKLGKDTTNKINLGKKPCLMCIAADFTERATNTADAVREQYNIKLISYRKFGNDLILFEQVYPQNPKLTQKSQPTTSTITKEVNSNKPTMVGNTSKSHIKSATVQRRGNTSPSSQRIYVSSLEKLAKAEKPLKKLYRSVRNYILSLGDDLTENHLKHYVAFRKSRNIACVQIYNREKSVRVHLSLDPKTVVLEEGFTRDVTNIGHIAKGNLEVRIRSLADFEKAKPMIDMAYNVR